MKRCKSFSNSRWRASVAPFAIALFLFAGAWQQASAAEGPFTVLPGTWTGTGKIHVGDKTERLRCGATYRLSSARNVNLALVCSSDTYKFDLTGDFTADESGHIAGQWTERSRSVGGTAIGTARGDRFQIHVESSGFSGNLVMVTRNRRQSVTLDAQGGEQKAEASIALSRGSQ